MLKKKITVLLAVLMLATALISGTGAYGAETTNLKLEYEALQMLEMPAGATVHMEVELSLKKGYCIEPVFSVTPENNAPVSFSNIRVKNKDLYNQSVIYVDENSRIVLEYDMTVDEFAQIGVYEYAISYVPGEAWMLEDEDFVESGKLMMSVSVVNEKMAPQISVVSGAESYCNAGDTALLAFTVRNEGELEALGTYVFADYYGYDEILTPVYTPLTQKIGNLAPGAEYTIEIMYKVAEDAKTQRVKIPLSVTYKTANGENGSSANAFVYLYIEGKPEATPTPSPTPTATPTPTPSPVPKTALLLLNSVKQSPSKPEAGEKLTVSFYLENAGTADVKNVKVMPVGLSSNSFEPINSEPYQYIEKIKAGKKQKVELTLRVGEDIPEGLNTLDVQYSFDVEGEYGTTTETEHVTLYILNVQNPEEGEVVISRPKLMVSDFYTDVEEVKAGGVFDFTFDILNTNDSIDAKNIKVTVSGASNAFSVTSGGNSFFVNAIKAGETAPITINLKASAAVTTGAYPIQIKIEYEYEGMVATSSYSGEVVEEEILLQVKENLRPSVENISLGWGESPIVNQPITMSFEFYNMGKSILNNTYVTIEGNFMLTNGSTSYYIGNISAGMPEHVEFEVIPLVEGDAVGKMIIHMEDSNGDEVTMEKEFNSYVASDVVQDNPGMSNPGMDSEYTDPSIPADGNEVEKPILPLWLFLCVQGAILVVVIPVTRAIRLAAYRNKIKREDAI